MGWLEDAKSILEDQERFEAEKHTRLSIDSPDSFLNDYSGIRSISISSKYSGPSIKTFLPEVLQKAHDLRSLHIYGQEITWDFVCSLNLLSIQDLYFTLNGDVTSERINAPELKKLCINGTTSLTPLELLVNPCPHIDFSNMTSLENLQLRYFQQVDPVDFQGVSTLKRLLVFYSDITDLNWLKDASYRLESLSIDGALENCSGIIYQPSLKELRLYHHYISDTSAIGNLKELKKLDLSYGNITNEAELRSMNVDELIINRTDYDISQIKTQVKDLVSWAVFIYRAQNKKAKKVEELSEFQKRFLLQTIAKPFEIRIRTLIQSEFSRRLSRIDGEEIQGFSLSKDEYRRIFIEETLKYCPFIIVKN